MLVLTRRSIIIVISLAMKETKQRIDDTVLGMINLE